ncbi:hypothetical protein PVK06_002468 [Gossypium arboreum]|uniref:Uncharacterized protein n=1 Tax=Gossypium arboreum TaxID=29729 RepID=A0ABR0R3T7_GOSAR|nr:hypothetical protein PVK06_002468 [Gossypium arboreum]
MDDFREVIDELSLVDLKTDNRWFTWVNNREGTTMVKERLDRFLILASDVDIFSFIETKGRKPREEQRDSRLMFRYNIYWAKATEVKNIIKNSWKMDMEDIMDKIENVGYDLGSWQFKRYKRMSRQIDALKSNINRLIDRSEKVYDGNKIKAMRLKLGKLLDREE